MSATLFIRNNFSIETRGITYTGKQGPEDDAATVAKEMTVNGPVHAVAGVLATGAAVTVYDDDDDVPVDFQYFFFWANVDMTVQLIGATCNACVKVLAYTPFTLSGFDNILAAASTTKITTTEPSYEDIDSIVIGNYSGSSGDFVAAVIN